MGNVFLRVLCRAIDWVRCGAWPLIQVELWPLLPQMIIPLGEPLSPGNSISLSSSSSSSFAIILNILNSISHDVMVIPTIFLKRLWDLEEKRPLATSVVSEAARAVAYSPDGQHLAVGLASGAFLVLTAE